MNQSQNAIISMHEVFQSRKIEKVDFTVDGELHHYLALSEGEFQFWREGDVPTNYIVNKEREIKLDVYGIVVSLTGNGGGSIVTELHEIADDVEDTEEVVIFNTAMDALESMILAHACAGIDITAPAYLEGIETAVQSCANNL